MTWDGQNRMVQCVSGSNSSTFTYGADGLRHRSVVNGTTTDFALDGQSVVQERCCWLPPKFANCKERRKPCSLAGDRKYRKPEIDATRR